MQLSEKVPGICIFWFPGEFQIRSQGRMRETDLMGPQCNLAGIIDLGIFPLAHQRHTAAGKLDPDLVGPAGMQHNAHFGKILLLSQDLIIQDRFLDTFRILLCHHGHTAGFIPVQQIHEGPLNSFRCSVNNGIIFLMKQVLPDLAGQFRGCFGISCQHHHTADHPVQPVDCTNIGFGI